jgi:hypothetical protein
MSDHDGVEQVITMVWRAHGDIRLGTATSTTARRTAFSLGTASVGQLRL